MVLVVNDLFLNLLLEGFVCSEVFVGNIGVFI